MRCVLLLLVLVAGCVTSQPETWENHGTGKMVCLRYEQEECGLRLWKCGPEHSVEFQCLSDAVYYGPGDKTAAPPPKPPVLLSPAPAKGEHPKFPADYAPEAQEDLQ